MASRSQPERAPTLGGAGFPEGAPCWIDVAAPDPRAAARFYGGLFGWAFDELSSQRRTGWMVARLRGLAVAGIGALPRYVPPPAWNVYVHIADLDAAVERVEHAGGHLLAGPFEVAEAGRAIACADPVGAAFRLWEPRAHLGAQLVDAPNAWLWSDLNTPDLTRSAAFYSQVLGWEAQPIDSGRGTSRVIRLPGAHGSHGGVEDAIGWMTQIPPKAGRVQPHWSVTFRVEDVDATARACADLGGMIVAPPFDAGTLTRAAIVEDPFGAAFSVTSYEAASDVVG